MLKNVSKITRALFLASVFAVILNIARVGISQKINFIFLIWNLFLAWVPYFLASLLNKDTSIKRFIIIFVPWLLFFPNAAYLITDILHVDTRPPIPLWYDSLIFFIFAWLGTMLGALALMKIADFIEIKYSRAHSVFSVIGISILTGFGIYLGRFERWNSWDALVSPLDLFKNIFNIWADIPHTTEPLIFTAVFSATILVTFYVVKEIVEDR